MKIFIDSAELEEIKQFYALGIADGVTTNPSLIKKAWEGQKKTAKGDMKKYLERILKAAEGTPVSLEVTERTAEGMIEQGRKLFKKFNPIARNVVIKIPINPSFKENDPGQFAGLEAIRTLSKEKIPVNCTLVFTPEQALLAAKAGAYFVSPFAGRVDDFLRTEENVRFDKSDYYPAQGKVVRERVLQDKGIVSGIDLVKQCVLILAKYDFKTKVLAASIRNPRQAREAALVGAYAATLPFEVIQDMLKHAKTFDGMKKFSEDVVKDYAELTVEKKPERKEPLIDTSKFGISVKIK